MSIDTQHERLQVAHVALGGVAMAGAAVIGGAGLPTLGVVALGLGLGVLAPANPGCALRAETPLWLALVFSGAPVEAVLLATGGAALGAWRLHGPSWQVAVVAGRFGWLAGAGALIALGMQGAGLFAVLGGLMALATADAMSHRSVGLHLAGWMGAASLGVLAAEQPTLDRALLLVPLLALFLVALDAMRRTAESAEREAELTRLAERDELTGLGNVRAFNAHLKTCRGERISMVALDLDGFKELNDIHGHFAGDRALKAVGQALSEVDDLRFFRTGGDEFIGVRQNDEHDGQVTETVRDALERLEVPVRGGTFPVRVSVGAATGVYDGGPELRGAADAEMYADKRLRHISSLRDGSRLVFERFDDRLAGLENALVSSQKAS